MWHAIIPAKSVGNKQGLALCTTSLCLPLLHLQNRRKNPKKKIKQEKQRCMEWKDNEQQYQIIVTNISPTWQENANILSNNR